MALEAAVASEAQSLKSAVGTVIADVQLVKAAVGRLEEWITFLETQTLALDGRTAQFGGDMRQRFRV